MQSAIARAATRTGVDFDYLLAQAKLESGLDPSAKAGTSSATGLYQFIDSTWLRTLDRHGAKHGMEWADAAIGKNGRVA
ncbi:MAG TPA: lytic transglycosylase, partial [Erythrobacter sp.]|nr:lytic transglycosylase [Erythrobacter sp.]